MNFVSSGDDSNPNDPNDPLHYAPRSVRNKANPQARPIRPASSPSGFDEMLTEAVARSKRHPLDPETVHQPDRPRARFGAAGRLAATIGVVAIIGFLFFSMIPKSQGSDPTSTGAANGSGESQALLQKFLQFEKSQDGRSAGAAQTTADESQTLLQKFVQWQQKQR
ncbi:hypothetical protein [Bradyrhizobium sp.]|uniref:hypothetical protein n=1 Tax=Bradyrhizobium sp. TaxID=376 RepID=UPI001D8FA364|nr:hypothetical protein [Bradyrhizobium sp.]MBV8700635.1 hypothetical protein [Bradyrhizobium sp.]MBV8923544.1 hypothetical protein [Bradyrhizobium sp.]MBV9983206.1 hypothetical protein [Bradyrhizobium sp.]